MGIVVSQATSADEPVTAGEAVTVDQAVATAVTGRVTVLEMRGNQKEQPLPLKMLECRLRIVEKSRKGGIQQDLVPPMLDIKVTSDGEVVVAMVEAEMVETAKVETGKEGVSLEGKVEGLVMAGDPVRADMVVIKTTGGEVSATMDGSGTFFSSTFFSCYFF